MSPRTKSKNIQKYRHFLDYKDPADIPFNELAEQLGVHPNRLRGMIRSAKHNPTIYTALREMGYQDNQIPSWFACVDIPKADHQASTVGPAVGAEDRSNATTRSERKTKGIATYTRDMVPDKNAQRPSTLSAGSALPATTYTPVSSVYQARSDPLSEELNRILSEILEEDMKARLQRLKKKRARPRKYTLDELIAIAEIYRIMQRLQFQNMMRSMFILNTMNRSSEKLNLEEVKGIFVKSFDKLTSRVRTRNCNDEIISMIQAIGKLLEPIKIPHQLYELYERTVDAKKENPKNESEAMIEIAGIIAENRTRENFELKIMKDQTEMIWREFWYNASQFYKIEDERTHIFTAY